MDAGFWNDLGSQPWVRDVERLLLAYILSLPIGWDRERDTHSVGLRTFPLVAMASCGYLLFGNDHQDPGSQSRILQGLITGIGFIGGGAILKQPTEVRGTATAASIWNTGVIGAAVAQDHWAIAIFLALANFVTLRWLMPLKQRLDFDADKQR